jgi:hypothetical protein
VSNALHRKSNRADLEGLLSKKVENVIIDVDYCQDQIDQILAALESKADYASLENLQGHVSQRLEELGG